MVSGSKTLHLSLERLEERHLLVGELQLLEDINELGNAVSAIDEVVPFGDGIAIAADVASFGSSLWTATPSGGLSQAFDFTSLTRSDPRQLFSAHGQIYFELDTDLGRELWVSDGTSSGTRLVKDIFPGPIGSRPTEFTELGSKVYFYARSEFGGELWRTDGTSSGTRMVKDIAALSAGSEPRELTVFGGVLYFVATDGDSGYELWRSDGSAGGTSMVKDIREGTRVGDGPSKLTVVDDSLLFAAEDGEQFGLWKSDGTEAGTQLVRPFADDADLDRFTALGKTLFFVATDEEHGRELWMSDGTLAGTKIVVDLSVGQPSGGVGELLASDNKLWFTAVTEELGVQFWVSDGTEEGTIPLRNMARGSDLRVAGRATLGDSFLVSFRRAGRQEIWISDGTQDGSRRLTQRQEYENPSHLIKVGDSVYFYATKDNDDAFWKVSETFTDVEFVGDLRPGTRPSVLKEFTASGEGMYFLANEQLWRSDLASHATKRVTTSPGAFENPRSLVDGNGKLFFVANDGVQTNGLWVSDGTTDGTIRVPGLAPHSGVTDLQPFEDGIIFTVNSSGKYRLWRTDGTAAGTTPIANQEVTGNQAIAVLNGEIFFAARVDGRQTIWRSDGSAGTSRMVWDGFTEGNPNVRDFTTSGELVYFTAQTDALGRELWRTDGTEGGTGLVRDIRDETFGASANPLQLTDVDGTLFFVARSADRRDHLWKTDGTFAGTAVLTSSEDESVDPDPDNLRSLDGRLYFAANGTSTGRELWTSDGTFEGTQLVMDINPGPEGSVPRRFSTANGHLFFEVTAFEGRGTRIGWMSDGTPEGTRQFLPDSRAIPTEHFIGHAGDLYFSAIHPAVGLEPYVYRPMAGDTNYDETVSFSDFLKLSANFGKPGTWATGDFDGDGIVGFRDFLMLASNFEREATMATASAASDTELVRSSLLDSDEAFTSDDDWLLEVDRS